MNEFNVIPKWNVSDNVKILVTDKNFLSKKDFNLSYTNNNYSITKKNRECLSNILPSTPHYIKQVHGKKIIYLDERKAISHVCDGIITKTKNRVISVLTADCIPVVISSLCGSIICILHVGRKGAEYNIINSAFKILKEYNYVFEAWIGPAISKNYYLVDIYIKNLFEHIDSQYSRFFYRNHADERFFHMDLIGIVSYQLKNNGVKNISYSELCTVKNNNNYYSHRLNSDPKRFGTFVWFE
jgi:YfiH family protein|tara:strand:- start:242 stop:964 length:723 start_codon:yes stop_codon:yes gene_type:complete